MSTEKIQINRAITMNITKVFSLLIFLFVDITPASGVEPSIWEKPSFKIFRACVDGNWSLAMRWCQFAEKHPNEVGDWDREVAKTHLTTERAFREPITYGNAAAARNNMSQARNWFAKAIKAAGDNPFAYVSLARAETSHQNFEAAFDAFLKALELRQEEYPLNESITWLRYRVSDDGAKPFFQRTFRKVLGYGSRMGPRHWADLDLIASSIGLMEELNASLAKNAFDKSLIPRHPGDLRDRRSKGELISLEDVCRAYDARRAVRDKLPYDEVDHIDFLIRIGRWSEARKILEKTESEVKDSAIFSQKGVELCMREGDLNGVMRFLSEIDRIAPDDHWFGKMRVRYKHRLAVLNRYRKIKIQNFLFFVAPEFNERRVELLEPFIDELKRDLERTLGLKGTNPQTIFLYNSEDWDEAIWEAPNACGFNDGTVNLSMHMYKKNQDQDWETIKRTLRHELVHGVVREYTSHNLPAWVNEGLAVLLDPTEPSKEYIDESLSWSNIPKPYDLNGVIRIMGGRRGAAIILGYHQSNLLMHLLAKKGGPEGMRAILLGLGAGKEVFTAIHDAVGWTKQDLDKAMKDWLASPPKATPTPRLAPFEIKRPLPGRDW